MLILLGSPLPVVVPVSSWAGTQLHRQQLPWPCVVSGGVSVIPAPWKVMETPSPGTAHGTGAPWAPGLPPWREDAVMEEDVQ